LAGLWPNEVEEPALSEVEWDAVAMLDPYTTIFTPATLAL